ACWLLLVRRMLWLESNPAWRKDMKQARRLSAVLSMILAVILCPSVLAQSADKTDSTTGREQIVVFVCEHGAAKSIVAAAYFNKLARERNLKFRAIARGTNPQEEISASATKGLQADGLTAGEQKPVGLARDEVSAAVRVVTFCALPADYKAASVEEWNDVPTVGDDYNKARDTIGHRGKHLLIALRS